MTGEGRATAGPAGADARRRAGDLLTRASAECAAGRLHDALGILEECGRLLAVDEGHALRGSLHSLRALTLRRLGAVEAQAEYYERAVTEYAAAVRHYERAGQVRHAAAAENDTAALLCKLGRYADAHEHLDRTAAALAGLNDAGLLAHMDETRARVHIAEGRYGEASRAAEAAIRTLEQGGNPALLADALAARGLALSRLDDREGSLESLRRAVRVAEGAGARPNAALAALTLMEEHGARPALSEVELYSLYRRADEMLNETQEPGEIARLRACAQVVMRRLADLRPGDGNFELFGVVREMEAEFIERALSASGGSVTRAARLLGIHHQTLNSMLQTRHSRLRASRTPPEKRRRSIIRKRED